MAMEPEEGEPGTATPVPSSHDFDTEQIMSFIAHLSNYENGDSLSFEKIEVCFLLLTSSLPPLTPLFLSCSLP